MLVGVVGTQRSGARQVEIAIFAAVLVAAAFGGLLLAPYAAAEEGPQDFCGYRWTDSNPPSPTVPYDWVDIQPTGSLITSWYGSDDGFAGPFDLGFNFTFYDQTYSQVYVDTNGYLSFDYGAGWIPWGSIPTTDWPNNFAMAFGADLFPGNAITPDGVYYEQLTSPNRFVVEYLDVPHYYNSEPVTFEIILYDTGEAWFQYNTVVGYVNLVGIENGDGTVGSPYSEPLADGLAVRFMSASGSSGPVGVGLSPCSQNLRVAPGSSADAYLTVTNLGAGADTFDMAYNSPSGWTASFYQADGVTPLNDTDSDSVPDTGPLVPDGFLDVILRVEVPSDANGSESLSVTATSSADTGVSASALVRVSLTPGALALPHSDFGLDTDSDGQFNWLVVAVNVSVAAGSMFEVEGSLWAPGFIISLYQTNYTWLDPGSRVVWLSYDGGQINSSGVDGPYTVDLNLYYYDGSTYVWIDSGTHATQAYSHLQFESPAAELTPPYAERVVDSDGDGQFNYLALDVNVTVGVATSYDLTGNLHDANWTLNIYVSLYMWLDVGIWNVSLQFDGARINASGIDGPYFIELALYRTDYWTFLDGDTYITAAYNHLEFESPPAEFAPPHADFGVDLDGDRLYDYLVIRVGVDVSSPDYYFFQGVLRDSSYILYQYRSVSTYLDVGLQSVDLVFDGPPINYSGVDGPYYVELNLSSSSGPVDTDFYVTAPYSHYGFDGDAPPEGTFFPPHSDFGYDENGDGLYDYLALDVNIAVGYGTYFFLFATLHDPSNALNESTYNFAWLNPGFQTVRLYFDGRPINASDVDGPYTVDLYLYDYYSGSLLDTDVHTTHAYNHQDFVGPPGRFVRPHSDVGLDTDGDGRYNLLDVRANVTTQYAGVFTVSAILFANGAGNSNLSLSYTNTTYLSGGPAVVDLFFSGTRINASGINGPYRVEMYLYDSHYGMFLDNDTYWTAPYDHTQFEEPPSISSPYTTIAPTIDGLFSAGEWADAAVENLTAIPGNQLPGYLLVKDDNEFLYIAYDVVGDMTQEPLDGASLSFDTGNDGIATLGHEDEFTEGGWYGQAHLVYGPYNWTVEDAPYNSSLPGHAGLASARGFGWSSHGSTSHRIYEFKIPLALLGAKAGDTLGLWGASYPMPGIFDYGTYRYSVWPDFVTGPVDLTAYGDLLLSPDLTAPTIAITAPASGTLLPTDSVTVSWTASDIGVGLDHFEISVDGSTPITRPAGERSATLTGLADGSHTIVVVAVDGAGNSEFDSVTVVVDTTPPDLALSSPVDGSAQSMSTITIEWSASDATSGVDHFEVYLDGTFRVTLPATVSSYAYSGVADGPHGVAVEAFDIAGNSNTVSAAIVVDTVAPTVAVTSPAAGAILGSASVPVRWTSADAGSGLDRLEVSLDGGAAVVLAPGSSLYVFASVADGSHSATVVAFDRAGNSRGASVAFTVDTTPPTLSIGSPADQAVFAINAVAVTWTSTDSLAGLDHFEVSLDGGTPITLGAGVSSYAFTGLSDGAHNIAIDAFDRVGNVRTSSVSVIVDTTAPSLSLTNPTTGGLVSTSAVSVAWVAADASSGLDRFELSIDGGTALVIGGSETTHTLAGVADGVHSITLTAVDHAGHTTTVSASFRVDTTAPTLSITSPSSGALIGTNSVQVTWTATDSNSGIGQVQVSVDGGTATSLASTATSYTFAGLADGTHTLTVKALDAAGNVQTASVQVTVNTFVLSPSGPYGVLPLAALLGAVAVVAVAAFLVLRRRRGALPPKSEP